MTLIFILSLSVSPFFSFVELNAMVCVTLVSTLAVVDTVEYDVSTGISVTLFQFGDKVSPAASAFFFISFILDISSEMLPNVYPFVDEE